MTGGRYTRCHPDLWLSVFNYQAIASVVTVADDHFQVNGNFRTWQDFIGIGFYSFDYWQHEYCRYPFEPDWTGFKWSFTVERSANVMRFDNPDLPLSLTVRQDEAQPELDRWVTLGMCRPSLPAVDYFVFTGAPKLSHKWIEIGSEVLEYWDGTAWVVAGGFGTGWEMDFVHGSFFTGTGSVPSNAECRLTYRYCHGDRYIIDFDNLWHGAHPALREKIDPTNIHSLMLALIPAWYTARDDGKIVANGRSEPFRVDIRDIELINGDLGPKQAFLPPNRMSVAESYDNETNKNPRRLIEGLTMCGFGPAMTLSLGASHYYDKKAPDGTVVNDVWDMTLDKEGGANQAVLAWTEYLAKAEVEFGWEELVISLSLENLQAPYEWCQLLYDGSRAHSGWFPPPSFFDPANLEFRAFLRRVYLECLDVAIPTGIKCGLQLGETWYWWQTVDPGTDIPRAERSPGYYGFATQERYTAETGMVMPRWRDIAVPYSPESEAIAQKLRIYLGSLATFVRSVSRERPGVGFTVLFYPPGIMQITAAWNVDWITNVVNFPKEFWEWPHVDWVQVEDYDWVVFDIPGQELGYELAWEKLGYPYSKTDYWAGFAGFDLPDETLREQWRLIERAAFRGLGKGFRQVYIWAGTQIRRDSWLPKSLTVIADFARYPDVEKP